MEPIALSSNWVLSQLAGMKFISSSGRDAHDYMKKLIEAEVERRKHTYLYDSSKDE